MAYAARGGSSRGGSGRSGGGGGSNATAYAVAGILVVLVIVLVLVLNKKKPVSPLPAPITPPTATPAPPPTPKVGEKPYPAVPEAMLNEGRNLVRTFDKDAAAADALYVESLKAKETGDEKTWQGKLRQAQDLYHAINNQWNAFIDRLPTGNGYDTEEVAKHYFPRESGMVQKYVKNLRAMKTDLK